jgi:hypothetical protein
MNCEEDEFGTFYKIKLLYSNLKFNVEKQLEYHLSKKNNCYIYHKFIDNKLVYMTNEFRANHMVKNIYHIMQNIEKLKEGKIKKYRIFSQLELEILCDYLKKNNIVHTIKIVSRKFRCVINKNLSYDDYIESLNVYKTYFNQSGVDYEQNKILGLYELYIQVYKGFVNLHQRKYLYQNSDVDIEIERPKYGVYIWPTYPYITT